MAKTLRPLLLLAALLIGVSGSVSTAQTAQPETKAVEADGLAAVLVDPVTARDRALADAKRRAVEQVAGVQVDSRALYSMGLSQDDWLRVRSFGFVKRWEIIQETPGKDRYAVKIRAWVQAGAGASPEAVNELLSRRSFVLFGQGDGAEIVLGRLKETLVDKGFSAYDEDFVRAFYDQAGKPLPAWGGSNAKPPRGVAEPLLADYVLRVRTELAPLGNTSGIQAFQAAAKVQLTEVSSGLIRAFAETSKRVFGLSKDQAISGNRPDQFRRAVAETAVQDFLAKLEQVKIGAPQPLRVTLQTPSAPAALDRLASAIAELRWVQACQKESFSPEAGVLSLEYPEKPVYLAADIDYLPGFDVLSYGAGFIVVNEDKR